MRFHQPEEESGITPKRIFFLLIKVVLALIGIMVASLFVLLIIRGEKYKGLFYLIFIIVSSLVVFRLYFKNVYSPPKLKPEQEPELYGTLEATAAMIWRASKGYDYSRDKLHELLRELRGKEYNLRGTGDQYLDTLKEILEEV